jgi:phenylacetate-CoA ligase
VTLAEVETLSPSHLGVLQAERLREVVERLRTSPAPYWRAKLASVPDPVGIGDLPRLPFTHKSEYRETYPYGMVAVPLRDVVRVHASSGTSGKPTIVAYTASDVGVFAEVNARALACAGAGPEDIVQIAYGYGLFTGGLGLHYGVEAVGATAVPASGGNVGFQVELLADLGATGLACTPSFSLLLAERAAEAGVLEATRLRWGIHGAEPWSEGMRVKIESAWGGRFDACDIYGLSEVIGPGVAAECRENKGGMHVMEDHFYPEIVDPVTGEPVATGEPGELVLTTLTRLGQPVLRYRTGDITRMLPGSCPCGRTTRRIGRIEGRSDDMLIIRGVNVYPRQIETVLMADPDVGGQFAIVVDERGTLPEVTAVTELRGAATTNAAAVVERLERRLVETLRVRIAVSVGEPSSIPRTDVGKAKRVFVVRTDDDPSPIG